jgi:hypothetical protein
VRKAPGLSHSKASGYRYQAAGFSGEGFKESAW